MADELNIPTHRWYQPRYNISLPNSDFSKQWIFNSGIQKIDAFIGGGFFSPSALFALAEPGVWFDPSDLSTLFQDPAGTTPVTAPGNTVGLMLDKSRGGVGTNGASRRNLLTFTEQFDNAYWLKSAMLAFGSGSFVNATTAPDGSNTAELIVPNTTDTAHGVYKNTGLTVAGATYTMSVYVKAAGYTWFSLSNTQDGGIYVNLSTGDVGGVSAGFTNPLVTPLANDWYRCSVTYTAASSTRGIGFYPASGDGGVVFAGDGTSGIYIWGAQLELASTVSTYQEITSDWPSTMAGNHATQATLAARPTYSIEPVGGRRNLLLNTDTLATQSLTVAAVAHTLAFTGTGTVTLTGASTAGPLVGTGAGNRVTLTFTPTAASLTLTVSGSVTLGQLQLGSADTPYQRVGTTQHDVTETGVASVGYLYFDGSDDHMVTSTITPATDKAQIFAGVRKLSDALSGAIVSTGTTNFSANQILLNAPSLSTATGASSPFANYAALLNRAGSTNPDLAPWHTGNTYAAPTSNVLTAVFDTALTDLAKTAFRVNGIVPARNSGTSTGAGITGNISANPVIIGRRATTNYLSGHLYSLITRFGPTLDAPTIASTEVWVAGKTGIVI